MESALKIFAISFLISTFMSMAFSANAEYNLATKKEEQIFFSTASEIKLGRSLVKKVEKRYKVSKDTQLQERINTIGQHIVAVCERKDISYFFTVLEEEKVNAFALPGGYIYINKGLIEKADSDDEIAGVLAHEIGHIVAKHSIKRLQAALGYNLISILAAAATKDARFKRGADIAFSQIMLGYSREDEILADQLAVKYVKRSGYNPKAVISFLKKLKQIEKEAPLKPLIPAYARTHPFIPERIGAAKQEVYGKMDFDDYLNRANQ
jgi:predicted Zn-dependent protease